MTGAITVICTMALLTVATAYLELPLPRGCARCSRESPILVISDGRVLERNLHRQRMTHRGTRAEARLQSIASLADVRYAVLETNGRVSFLKADQ